MADFLLHVKRYELPHSNYFTIELGLTICNVTHYGYMNMHIKIYAQWHKMRVQELLLIPSKVLLNLLAYKIITISINFGPIPNLLGFLFFHKNPNTSFSIWDGCFKVVNSLLKHFTTSFNKRASDFVNLTQDVELYLFSLFHSH